MNSTLARANYADSATVIAQVRDIAKLMGAGQWIIGVTEHDKAEEWGVELQVVRRRAAEARRLVAHAFGNIEDLRTDVLSQLAGIAGEQRTKEPRTAVAALLGIAAVTGIIVTHRVDTRDVKVSKNLSPTQRRAEIARIRAQLDQADADAAADEQAEGNTIDVPSE